MSLFSLKPGFPSEYFLYRKAICEKCREERLSRLYMYCGQTYCKYIQHICTHIVYEYKRLCIVHTKLQRNKLQIPFHSFTYLNRYIKYDTQWFRHAVYHLEFSFCSNIYKNQERSASFCHFPNKSIRPFHFPLLGCMILIPPVGMRGIG
jgi:hypothetical protein